MQHKRLIIPGIILGVLILSVSLYFIIKQTGPSERVYEPAPIVTDSTNDTYYYSKPKLISFVSSYTIGMLTQNLVDDYKNADNETRHDMWGPDSIQKLTHLTTHELETNLKSALKQVGWDETGSAVVYCEIGFEELLKRKSSPDYLMDLVNAIGKGGWGAGSM